MMTRYFILMLVGIATQLHAQNTFKEALDPFNKLVVDPYINVELVQGDYDSIAVNYAGIDPGKIFVEQQGRTLRLFLQDARIGVGLFADEFEIEEKYRHAKVWVRLTFKSLKNIQFRGQGELISNGSISGKKLKLKAYGETDVKLFHVDLDRMKVALYGDNSFYISSGQVFDHTINTYGENRVDVSNLTSHGLRSNSFGENRLAFNATDILRVVHFGDGEIQYAGRPVIERRWIIGDVNVRQLR